MQGLILMTLIVPLLAAVVIAFIPNDAKDMARGIALIAALISTVFSVITFVGFDRASTAMQFHTTIDWVTIQNAFSSLPLTVSFAFGVDGISLPLFGLVGIVSIFAVIRSFTVTERVKTHYFWMMVLIASLYGVFGANDLFTFFFFLEATLAASFFLIHIFGGEKRQYAATKFLIYRGFASVVLLAGLIGLAYAYARQAQLLSTSVYIPWAPQYLTLMISHLLSYVNGIRLSAGTQDVLFLVFLLAVMIEEAFVPFHTWLPDTHENSDTGTNMLIGGVLMKVGLYVLIRFGVELLPDGLRHYAFLVALLGVISILYGAFAALAAKDWRRLIAFTGISHMGLVLVAIASMQAVGIQGAVFMLVSSGLLTALLFFTVGAVADRTGTFTIHRLGGLSKSLPVLSGVMLVAALGLVGLPGTSGFISEVALFVGSFATFPILATIATLGMIFAALYLLYAMQRTTYGPLKVEAMEIRDAHAIEYVPMVVLVALVIGIGVYPDLLGSVVHGAAQAIAAKIGG